MIAEDSNDLVLLLGEKAGKQARDNGFFFFEHRISQGYKNTYFVYTHENIDINKIKKYKENILLKDSRKHISTFHKADYLLLNDGYLDVFPTTGKSPLSKGWSPIIYLQHGIISYKKVHFYKGHYNGRIRSFITSLFSEKNIVSQILQPKKDINQTKKLVLKYKIPHFNGYTSKEDLKNFYSFILEKYYRDKNSVDAEDLQTLKRLINNIGFLDTRVVNAGLSRHKNLSNIKKTNKNILFFFTWREEWTVAGPQNSFLEIIKSIKNSKSLMEYAKRKKLNIAFYLHEKVLHLKDDINSLFNNDILFVGQEDFSEVLSDTAICVTDYSSISFEFNLLKTPVIFLQFDYDQYKFERGHFLDSPYDFNGTVVRKISDLESLFSQKNIRDILKKSAISNHRKVLLDYENYKNTNAILDDIVRKKQEHIVYFCYNLYGVGGTVQTVINQANHLVERGYQVSIISLRRTAETPKLHLDPSVRLEYLNDARSKGRHRTKWENHLAQYPSLLFKKTEDLYSGLSLLTDLKLKKVLKTIKNATLVGTFPGLCVNILKNAHKSNIVMVQEHKEFSSHSSEIQKSLIKHYNKAHKVVALTKFQREEFNAQGFNNVINIPNGIEDKLELLARAGLHKKQKRIVSFGRLVKIKQFDLLIQAFSHIATSYPDWKVDIYGDGEDKDMLLQMIDDLRLNDQVTIHSPTSLVYEEIYNSAFCALTASKEPFGMVYIESFSMSKPVVSFDIGYGPKEFLVDGYNSLISPCFDTQDFAKKMEMLMTDENLLQKLGDNARQTYINNYEISKVMDKFLRECK